MRKEGTGITSSHIESAAFQHWRTMYGSFASNPVIDNEKTTSESNKEVPLAVFSGMCHKCGKHGHKEADCYSKQHINGQALGAKQGTNSQQHSNEQKNNAKSQKKTWWLQIVCFDIKITTANVVLYAIYMKQTQAEHANVVTNKNKPEKNTKMSVLQAHEKLRHINACATVQIADSLGWDSPGIKQSIVPHVPQVKPSRSH